MDCLEAQALLHGYLDKELDLIRAIEVEEHLQACTACQETYHVHDAARSAIREHATHFTAPEYLRGRILSALPAATKRNAILGTLSLTWLNFGATLAFVSIVTLGLSLYLAVRSQDEHLTEEIISSHVRSLMANHLADIASSDQHAVKPWFNGRLDFSPPVNELTAQGFPLVGGRLDYIENRPVAALVYRHRQHLVNLFIWPASRDQDSPARTLSRQGYNLIHWEHAGMVFWAISDLNPAELRELVLILVGPTPGNPG